MTPEHEEFLSDHVRKMGFMFIVDLFKRKFPDLSHESACAIYKEFRAKHAEEEGMKQADSQLKAVGKQVAGEIEKAIKPKQ